MASLLFASGVTSSTGGMGCAWRMQELPASWMIQTFFDPMSFPVQVFHPKFFNTRGLALRFLPPPPAPSSACEQDEQESAPAAEEEIKVPPPAEDDAALCGTDERGHPMVLQLVDMNQT
eukprot:1322766-Amphidinium_carterae.1